MNFRILKDKNEIYILELHGSINLYDSNRIKELVMKLIEYKNEKFIIDLKNVESMNSASLGALVYVSSNLKKLNCALAITNVNGLVLKAIEVTKLSGLLPIVPTLKEAVETVSGELPIPGNQ